MPKISQTEFRAILEQEREGMLDRWAQEEWWKQKAKRNNWQARPTAWDLNCGGCEDFAVAVEKQVPDVELIWGEEAGYGEALSGGLADHMYICWQGRYYDAQELDGVDDPLQLPLARGVTRTAAEREGSVDGMS